MNEADFERIKAQLNASHEWPGVYMFKFIVPADNEKIARVEALFNSHTAEVRIRPSKNGNYISITARELMMSAEQVLACYEKASHIEGLIAL
jgi:putative lipoic acid-binding regulatory protein